MVHVECKDALFFRKIILFYLPNERQDRREPTVRAFDSFGQQGMVHLDAGDVLDSQFHDFDLLVGKRARRVKVAFNQGRQDCLREIGLDRSLKAM